MQNAGLQYGEGVTPVQESPFVSTPVNSTTNSTSSLRQFRKKENVDKAVNGGAANPDSANSSHVARVAPHNHYPHKQNEYFRYPSQYQEYSSPYKEPTVKYSEIAEPVIQSIPHLDHLPASVLTKHKEKEYVEMCNIPQQSHINKSYPEHQFNGQQGYPPEMSMHHQYMHKEPQGSQMHSSYKPESQYIPKEGVFNHQIPPFIKYNIPQSRNYATLENSSLTPFQRMDPHLARSFMADHHHIREFPPTEYSPMEQSRMYAQKQRYYPTPLPPSNSTYPSNYPHRNMPSQQFNYPSCNYPRTAQMNPAMGRYQMNMERSMSPRRTYPDNMDMSMNFPPVPQKITGNYPNYPAYAQHYQQRRPTVPQEYYHPQQHPHSRPHAQYMPNHHPQEIPENHVASNNIRQYLENWAEEEPSAEIPTPIENPKYISRLNREEANEVYVINASELPQYLENGVPLIASENGQYIFKSNVSIDNTGAIKILDKTVENAVLPTDAQERVVSLHIIENPKTDCLVNNRPPEHQPAATINVIATNHENSAHRPYNNQAGYNRMNMVHQVSPMTQTCDTSINLSLHASNSPQHLNKTHSRSPGEVDANTKVDEMKIQVLGYNEVPQNSCIVMPSTQNRLNFDESLLPNPVPCESKKKEFEVRNSNNDANSVISNVMNEEAILKEAHEELDKIVQDTLTSTNMHMPLESCDRNHLPKIEEKCDEENLNSRIPDFLNLDLESHPKDLRTSSNESPAKDEPLENEAIIDLSTTSRRTSKSENEEQDSPNQTQESNNEKKDVEIETDNTSGDNSSSTIKHMPLIFDGLEDNETQTKDSEDKKSKDEDEETTITSITTKDKKEELNEAKEEKVKEENEDNTENEKEESIQMVPENSATRSQSLTPSEEGQSPSSIKEEREPTSEENEAIVTEKTESEKDSQETELKEDVSKVISGTEEVKSNSSESELINEDSQLSESKEHNVEDKEEDCTRQVESSEETIAVEVSAPRIKRKRIFSVDDIIYRIGSTASQLQNVLSKSNEENDKQNEENEEQKSSTECFASPEVNGESNELKQEEDVVENKPEITEKEETINNDITNITKEDNIDNFNEESDKDCKTETESSIEEDSSEPSPNEATKSKQESGSNEDEPESSQNIEITEKTEDTFSEIEDANFESANTTEETKVEASESEPTIANKVEIEESEPIENEEIETAEIAVNDRPSKEKSEDEIPCVQMEEEAKFSRNSHEETCENQEETAPIENTDLPIPQASEESLRAVEEENKDDITSSEETKIESNAPENYDEEINTLNEDTTEEIEERTENPEERENNDGKTEKLKRTISETDISNEENHNEETEIERCNKRLKLDDIEPENQETNQESDIKTEEDINVSATPIQSCRFSVIQRTETLHKEVKEEKIEVEAKVTDGTNSTQIERQEEEISSFDEETESKTISQDTTKLEIQCNEETINQDTPEMDIQCKEELSNMESVESLNEIPETAETSVEIAEEEVLDKNTPIPRTEVKTNQTKEEITFEQRFVEPLLNNSHTECPKSDHQDEKLPSESFQYRSVLKIEENMVLLEICGELVEISVNQINGRKTITVVPISNSATVDINDNYEQVDRGNHTEEIATSNAHTESEMPELYEETSVDLGEEIEEKNLPVLVKMISSSEDEDQVIRNEEISSTQTETLESMSSNNEDIFEDIILNENEIIIGDETLEEEINLDLKDDDVVPEEKPVLCTKASKKLYDDIPIQTLPKTHNSLRDFRKIKTNKTEVQAQPIDKKNDEVKNKKLQRTSTRQKSVSEHKEESQVALQELVKQRKIRKEKIRLKYSQYVVDEEVDKKTINTPDRVKIRPEKEVKSEIRKVSNIVKVEKNQLSSVVHKVKSDTKRKESSENHGTKSKNKEKLRRKSIEGSREKIHLISSVIVKEPCGNLDSDKKKLEEKPTSTSQIGSNPSTQPKDLPAQNFQDGLTSPITEVTKYPNVQEKHSKFPKISTPRDLSLTKNINEHYLSRKDHSNLKKKLSIQEYNSRKRKMEETKVPTPEKVVKIVRVEEPQKEQGSELKQHRPSTIYSGRQFENISNCVKDPRRLQFMYSGRPGLSRANSEDSSSSRMPNISPCRSLSIEVPSPSAIILGPLLNEISPNNQSKNCRILPPERLMVDVNQPSITTKSTHNSNNKYEAVRRRVSFEDNVQINEIHTTQTKAVRLKQDSNTNYCEVTSSCSDNFEEKSFSSSDDRNFAREYPNNLIKRIQEANDWEDSNSPKDCLTDAFADSFLDKTKLEPPKNTTKSKLIIDINDFHTSLINSELNSSSKSNSTSSDEGVKNYKEEVDIKLNSLNIQIPKTTKNRVLNEDDMLMHKFLRKEQLSAEEIKQIRRIIYYKKKIQQLTQQNLQTNPKTPEENYEIKKSPESSSNKELKLQFKKVDGKVKKKKKRFRNLYSNSPETSENELQETAGEFSVYEGENISGVKLIFKRKTDYLNLQPVVKLQRCRYIDSMAKKLKYE